MDVLSFYDVDINGSVYVDKKEVKQYTDKDGYKTVACSFLGKTVNAKVHRLIAIKYIPNPENKKQVNHKNGIKSDNRVENLEWVTQSENLKHSYDFLGRKSPAKDKKGKDNWSSKSVVQMSLDGFIINEFESAAQAAKETGVCRQEICKARSGTKKKAGGYLWV